MRSEFLPKYSKDRPHHYFFGVGMEPLVSENAGKLFLKYGPIYVHNNDIDRVCDALMRSTDEVFKQTAAEAMKIEGCYELGIEITMMRMSCNANSCTMHHISSAEDLGEEAIIEFVNMANSSEELKKKLIESRIK